MNYSSYPPSSDPHLMAAAAQVPPRAPEEAPEELDDPPAAAPRYASVDELLTVKPEGATDEEDFTLPATGLVVRIRPLTRAEVLKINNQDLGLAEREQRYTSKAMVEPRMTVEAVKRWQEYGHAGDMGELIDRIGTISGLTKGGEKAAAKQFSRSGE